MSRFELAARAGGWRDWEGKGVRPVSANTKVSILMADGGVDFGIAGTWEWSRGQGPDDAEPDDIVAYRVHSPAYGELLAAA